MCKCMQELAEEYSKGHYQNRRDAQVVTETLINIHIRPYVFDNILGTRLAKHTIIKSISPKFCPMCGKKVHGYQTETVKGGLVARGGLVKS